MKTIPIKLLLALLVLPGAAFATQTMPDAPMKPASMPGDGKNQHAMTRQGPDMKGMAQAHGTEKDAVKKKSMVKKSMAKRGMSKDATAESNMKK